MVIFNFIFLFKDYSKKYQLFTELRDSFVTVHKENADDPIHLWSIFDISHFELGNFYYLIIFYEYTLNHIRLFIQI